MEEHWHSIEEIVFLHTVCVCSFVRSIQWSKSFAAAAPPFVNNRLGHITICTKIHFNIMTEMCCMIFIVCVCVWLHSTYINNSNSYEFDTNELNTDERAKVSARNIIHSYMRHWLIEWMKWCECARTHREVRQRRRIFSATNACIIDRERKQKPKKKKITIEIHTTKFSHMRYEIMNAHWIILRQNFTFCQVILLRNNDNVAEVVFTSSVVASVVAVTVTDTTRAPTTTTRGTSFFCRCRNFYCFLSFSHSFPFARLHGSWCSLDSICL